MLSDLIRARCSFIVLFCCVLTHATPTFGFEEVTGELKDDTYNFVSHYSVLIKASPEEVWSVLIQLDKWMYDFELKPLAGNDGQAGQILNLYAGQPFQIQISAAQPNRLLVIQNLPITFKNEYGTGTTVTTLHKTGEGTEVSLTMSRRYSFKGVGDNALRKQRESEVFQQQTRAMWEQRFLPKLKELVEHSTNNQKDN